MDAHYPPPMLHLGAFYPGGLPPIMPPPPPDLFQPGITYLHTRSMDGIGVYSDIDDPNRTMMSPQPGSQRSRRRQQSGSEHVKHRRTRSGCYTCRQRRVKVCIYQRSTRHQPDFLWHSATKLVPSATVRQSPSSICSTINIHSKDVERVNEIATIPEPIRHRNRRGEIRNRKGHPETVDRVHLETRMGLMRSFHCLPSLTMTRTWMLKTQLRLLRRQTTGTCLDYRLCPTRPPHRSPPKPLQLSNGKHDRRHLAAIRSTPSSSASNIILGGLRYQEMSGSISITTKTIFHAIITLSSTTAATF